MARIRLRAWLALAGLAATVVALVRAGDGALGGPPLSGWEAAEAWYEEVGPVVAAVSFVRGVALVVAGWMLVVGVVQLGLLTFGGNGARHALAPAAWQRALVRLAGVSLATGLSAAPASMALAQPADEPGTATVRVLDEPPRPSPPAAAVAAPTPAAVVVAAGDSFWTIAATALATGGASDPPDRAVLEYWHRLIEANRATLVDPSDPDLLHPGQHLTLPPLT